jgi:hypothetical protein
MSSPGNKPDPGPAKFFEGANQRPAPKTREEAGQLAIDMRHDELDRIADPQQREKAEKDLRSHAEKTYGTMGKIVEKARTTQARWEQKINSMSEKNPLRAAAAPVFRAVQNRQHQKIGRMVLKDAHKDAAIITRAQKTSETFRLRQAQNQPGKDIERER